MRKQSTESDVSYRPDFSQMVPYKPKIQWNPGEHVAPGIVWSISCVCIFCNNLIFL